MTYLRNERGNAVFFLIGTLSIVGVIFLIVMNIGRAFVIGAHASNVAEQAAYTATHVYVEKTNDAIKDYDSWFILQPDFIDLGIDKVGDLVDDKHEAYKNAGYGNNQAYIMALNHVLPNEINSRPIFKQYLKSYIANITTGEIFGEIYTILDANDGDFIKNETEFLAPYYNTDWRVQVKVKIKFSRIADGEYINDGEHKYDRTGYGPELTYLEELY
ncbi:Tad domain-containing protein [Bacillaceae bacterium W0354]